MPASGSAGRGHLSVRVPLFYRAGQMGMKFGIVRRVFSGV